MTAELGTMITFSGTRHKLGKSETSSNGWRRGEFQLLTGACSESVVVEDYMQPAAVKDCKRCFPPSSDFSSSTLTDLQTAQQQLDQARDIAVRLEQENAQLRSVLDQIEQACADSEALHRKIWDEMDDYADIGHPKGPFPGGTQMPVARVRRILAAAPVDGGE